MTGARGPEAAPDLGAGGDRSAMRGAVVPIGATILLVAMLGLVLLTAHDTLGYDYRCYEAAAHRVLDGAALYDNAYSINVGECPGTYTYPPPFAVGLIPMLLLPSGVAAAAWSLAMAACLLLGLAIVPVRRDVRWLLVILAAIDWPFLYSVKLGQVGPLLFLLFAVAWRWIDRPAAVGVPTAIGALVKVQPGLVVLWALATRRFRAAAVAVGAAVVAAAAATLVTGTAAWRDYLDLLTGLNGSLGAQHNVAVGAVARQAGLAPDVAAGVQLTSAGIAVAAMLAAWRWTPAVPAFLATVLASQLVASPLRDHYAVLLLLPTAWLLDRGRTWAVPFPVDGWLSLAAAAGPGDTAGSWVAGLTVPLSFFACLAAVLVEGALERWSAARPAETVAASTTVAPGRGAILRP